MASVTSRTAGSIRARVAVGGMRPRRLAPGRRERLLVGRDPGPGGLYLAVDDPVVAREALALTLLDDAVLLDNLSYTTAVTVLGGPEPYRLEPGERVEVVATATVRIPGRSGHHDLELLIEPVAAGEGAATRAAGAAYASATAAAPAGTAAEQASQATRGLPHLPGLDGLRALAVLAVLAFHADYRAWRGGYLGVEVFFVISGYLITLLLLGEQERSGTIDLRRFWIRRARRLLPALGALLVGTAVLAAVVAPDALGGLGGDIVAASLYVTNWHLIVAHVSYFEGFGRPSLLRHLWSLAIEEQFYLLWPVVLGSCLRRFGRHRTVRLVGAGTLLSVAAMFLLFHPGGEPTRVYYGTDTRAAALLIGALLAFRPQPWRTNSPATGAAGPGGPAPEPVPPRAEPGEPGGGGLAGSGELGTPWARVRVLWSTPSVVTASAAVALLALLWLFHVLDGMSTWLYRGGFLATSLLTVLVIRAAVRPSTVVARLLSWRPLQVIGVRSYSLYLWHWPVFMVTRPRVDVTFGGVGLFVVRFGATAVLAECSYRLVECPVREGRFVSGLRAALSGGRTRVARVAVPAVAPLLTLAVLVAVQAPPVPASLPTAAELAAAGLVPDPGTDTAPAAGAAPATAAGAPAPSESTPTTVAGAPAPATGNTPETETESTVPSIDAVTSAPVLAVGDSVLLGASSVVRRLAPAATVDARIGRQWWEAGDEIAALGRPGSFGRTAIVHLGNNGRATASMVEEVLDAIGPVDRVILVTVRVPRPWEQDVNDEIIRAAQRHRNVVIADWHSLSNDRREYFVADGVHLSTTGLAAYQELLAAVLA